MCPDGFGADGVVGVAVEEEVVEEAHVLEGEEGELVLGLVDYLGGGGVFAGEACFEAVGAGGGCFLALGGVRFWGCWRCMGWEDIP